MAYTQSGNFPKDYPHISDAKNIEEILCLSTLIATGELGYKGTIEDMHIYFREELNEDCSNCPFKEKCLACLINE